MRLAEITLHRVPLRTRLPFRYGIATMTAVDHVFLRLTLETPGGAFPGLAADHLPPRWFRKDAAVSLEDEQRELHAVIGNALRRARELGDFPTPFAAWEALWAAQAADAVPAGWPPLLAHFGTSLVERALLDAFARAQGQPLHALVLGNTLGLDLGRLAPSLSGRTPADFLPAAPLDRVALRHTVGMADPLTDTDVVDAPADGLPVSLEANIRAYGLRRFKLKLSGDIDADLERLRRTATAITRLAPADFRFSLDGNEQFPSADALRDFGGRVSADPILGPFLRHLLFLEQPFPRSRPEVSPRGAWPTPVPVILDEGDGDLPDLPCALEIGYAGVSHKNCKGIFKGLRNACLVRAHGGVTTGEDLANVGPVALLQDLALQALLGNADVERNGHHYFAGLSGFPRHVAEAVAAAHPDLYAADPALGARLRITDGQIDLTSVNSALFGYGFPPAEIEKR